jgi:hypothetical protein
MMAIEAGLRSAEETDKPDKSEVIFVRIKPRNKRKGLRMRRYRVFGIQFNEAQGWHKVSRWMSGEVGGAVGAPRQQLVDMKEYFANVRNTENEDSPLAFDVCNEETARSIDEEERKKAEPKRKSAHPVDLTSADVRPGRLRAVDQTTASAPPTPERRGPGRPRKPRTGAPAAEAPPAEPTT